MVASLLADCQRFAEEDRRVLLTERRAASFFADFQGFAGDFQRFAIELQPRDRLVATAASRP